MLCMVSCLGYTVVHACHVYATLLFTLIMFRLHSSVCACHIYATLFRKRNRTCQNQMILNVAKTISLPC